MKQATLEKWQSILNDQQTSGLSAVVYCKQHNITQSAFYRYKAIIQSGNKTAQKVVPTFIKATPRLASSEIESISLNIESTSLSLPMAVSPSWLAQLLKELRT